MAQDAEATTRKEGTSGSYRDSEEGGKAAHCAHTTANRTLGTERRNPTAVPDRRHAHPGHVAVRLTSRPTFRDRRRSSRRDPAGRVPAAPQRVRWPAEMAANSRRASSNNPLRTTPEVVVTTRAADS